MHFEKNAFKYKGIQLIEPSGYIFEGCNSKCIGYMVSIYFAILKGITYRNMKKMDFFKLNYRCAP